MTTEIKTLVVICASGGFGGFIAALRSTRSYKLKLPFRQKTIELGAIGDVCIGIAAALGIFEILELLAMPATESSEWLKMLAVGILAGASGRAVLDMASNQILKRIKGVEDNLREVKDTGEIIQLMRLADRYMERNHLEAAEHCYDKILAIDAEYVDASLNKSKIYKLRDALPQAIRICEDVLDKNPTEARTLFNLACYKCLAGQNPDDVIDLLERAISQHQYYAEMAKEDPDLNAIRTDPRFVALITRT